MGIYCCVIRGGCVAHLGDAKRKTPIGFDTCGVPGSLLVYMYIYLVPLEDFSC